MTDSRPDPLQDLPDLPVGLWRYDPATDGIALNPQAEALLGVAPSGRTRVTLANLLDRHLAERPTQTMVCALAALGGPVVTEPTPFTLPGLARFCGGDGRLVWLHWQSADAAGAASGPSIPLTGTVQDVSAIVEALCNAQEVVRASEFVEAALDGAEIGLWYVAGETEDVWSSESWYRVLGYDAGEHPVTDAAFFDMLHPDDRDRAKGARDAAFTNPGSRYECDFRMRRKDGSYAWIGASGRVVDNPHAPGGRMLVGSQSDISARMKTRRQLEVTAEAAKFATERLERLTENVPGGIFEFVMTAEGRMSFPYATSGMGRLMGTSAEALMSAPEKGFVHIHPDDFAGFEEAVELSRNTLCPFKYTYRINHPEFGLRWVRVNTTPAELSDGKIVWYGSIFDVTEEVEREQTLKTTAEMARVTSDRLVRLTENVPGGIFEFSMSEDGGISFPYVTSGMADLLGTTVDVLKADGAASFALVHPDDAKMVASSIMASQASLELFNLKYRIIHPRRGLRWIQVKSTPGHEPDGSVVWYGSLFDITEEMARAEALENARSHMEHLSLIDALTQLPNRRACDEEMMRRVADEAVVSDVQTVIRIDLDHFKAVNDTLGHAAGDAVLCRVGDCLRDTIGVGDFAARLGGDEFIILMAPGKGRDDAEMMIDRLRMAVLRPFMFEDRHCRFDASFGYASTEELSEDLGQLISFADAALLTAKEAGRGRAAMFTADMHEGLIRNRRRAGEIQLALDRQEFVPYFQPQIDARTGEISGFEVLARWHHPVEGMVPPDDFIPVAQQMRVVQDIDKMMFVKAQAALRRLQEEGFVCPKLSFNVSAGRIHDPDIVASVHKLQTHGTQIAFELLESILLEEEGALFEHHIDLLKDNGINIEVDDFGSGRASIIGVLRVAPDTLKIDRRLIEPLFDSKSMRGLVRAIIDIGRSLDIQITAEGVETMDHAWELRKMGCRTLQGYAFARPMTEDDLTDYIAAFTPVFGPDARAGTA